MQLNQNAPKGSRNFSSFNDYVAQEEKNVQSGVYNGSMTQDDQQKMLSGLHARLAGYGQQIKDANWNSAQADWFNVHTPQEATAWIQRWYNQRLILLI